MKPIVSLESLVLKSANAYRSFPISRYMYRQEFTVVKLEKQLGILVGGAARSLKSYQFQVNS